MKENVGALGVNCLGCGVVMSKVDQVSNRVYCFGCRNEPINNNEV